MMKRGQGKPRAKGQPRTNTSQPQQNPAPPAPPTSRPEEEQQPQTSQPQSQSPPTKRQFGRYGEKPLRDSSVGNWKSAKNYFEIFLALKGYSKFDELCKTSPEVLLKPELYQEFSCYLVEHAVMTNGDSLSKSSCETYMSGSSSQFISW